MSQVPGECSTVPACFVTSPCFLTAYVVARHFISSLSLWKLPDEKDFGPRILLLIITVIWHLLKGK